MDDALFEGDPENVLRLAKWLGVAPGRLEDETNRSFRARCAFAILRHEKRKKFKAAKRAKMKASRA